MDSRCHSSDVRSRPHAWKVLIATNSKSYDRVHLIYSHVDSLAQTLTPCKNFLHSTFPSTSVAQSRPMSRLSQGTSVPSGHTGPQSALIQPLSGNCAASTSTLTRSAQTSPEQSISNQIRKLTVSVLIDFHDLAWAEYLPRDTSKL